MSINTVEKILPSLQKAADEFFKAYIDLKTTKQDVYCRIIGWYSVSKAVNTSHDLILRAEELVVKMKAELLYEVTLGHNGEA